MTDESEKSTPPPQDQPRKQAGSQTQQQLNQLQQQQQQFSAVSGSAQSQSQSQKPRTSFFSGYQPPEGVFDEQLDSEGAIRDPWTELHRRLSHFSTTSMENRCKQIRRAVHQNGHAYSAYGDPTIRDRHLQLDPLPLLIPAAEWERIDVALKQRANLLNKMLDDIYGPRTLLTDGILPPEVLFNHPHYQLPHHGLPVPGHQRIHLYAAELIRAPDGDWWVASDRTDSPGGSGFALENRIVISRTFPNEFRGCNVMRLAPYFSALREHLVGLAKNKKENPHIAVLTAGAGSVSYFEDSFLARYLGFTLVEANDLVVRSGKVMLKTLTRLEPIDVILRRQQGNTLDPLELGGGAAGIAGILQAIRDENVVVVNACGSGLVESPVFMAFLPRICQAMTQTDLMLPGVATWWGGETASLELMLDRIDDINLLPAFRSRTVDQVRRVKSDGSMDPRGVHPENLSREQRIALLQDNPMSWVGQEKVTRSSAAIWEDERLDFGHVSLRTFLTASGDSWCSLPGGLTRITDHAQESTRNPFQDGGAKDTWVLADKPVTPVSLLKQSNELLAPSRGSGFLPSRVAENLCWLGRYLERADAAARLLRGVVTRMTDETDPVDSAEMPVLIRTLGLTGQIDAGYGIAELVDKLPPLETELPKFALDYSDPNSLYRLVDQVLFSASRVRDRLSSDSWRIISQTSNEFASCDPKTCELADLLDLTDNLVVSLAAFSGLTNESMTRTHAFRFLNIGRRLEQSLQIAALLKHCFASQTSVTKRLLEAILEISDSSMTYRARYYANLQLPTVLDLLLIDEMNPRSLAFQLSKLDLNLESLPGNADGAIYSTDRQLAMDALHAVRMANVNELCEFNDKGERETLGALLEKIEAQMPLVSTSISNRFLVHSGPINQLIRDEFSSSSSG